MAFFSDILALMTEGQSTSAAVVTPPATPTITFADDGDGTGGTLTIADGDAGVTNTAFYQSPWGTSWTSGGSRSGNGTVALTLTAGRYYVYVVAEDGDGCTTVSAPLAIAVTSSTDLATPELAVKTLLTDDANVSGLIGSKVYVQIASQRAKAPYIILRRVSAPHEHTMTAAAGTARARLQLECYGSTYDQAKLLADYVRGALDGYAGNVVTASGTLSGVSIMLDDDGDGFENPASGKGRGTHRVMSDYFVRYTESVPTF